MCRQTMLHARYENNKKKRLMGNNGKASDQHYPLVPIIILNENLKCMRKNKWKLQKFLRRFLLKFYLRPNSDKKFHLLSNFLVISIRMLEADSKSYAYVGVCVFIFVLQ